MLSFKKFLLLEVGSTGVDAYEKRFKGLFTNEKPYIDVTIKKGTIIMADAAAKQKVWTVPTDVEDTAAQLLSSNFPKGNFPTGAANPWVEVKLPEKPQEFSDTSWKKNKSYWVKFNDIEKPGGAAGKSKVPVKPQNIFSKDVGQLKVAAVMTAIRQKYGENSVLYQMAVDTSKNGYPNNPKGYDISSLGEKAGEAVKIGRAHV